MVHQIPERYEDRTPLYDVDEMDAPVLIIHGTSDQNVDIEHAYQLEFCLQDAGKRVETWYSFGLKHHYPPKLNRETVQALCNWMKKEGMC